MGGDGLWVGCGDPVVSRTRWGDGGTDLWVGCGDPVVSRCSTTGYKPAPLPGCEFVGRGFRWCRSCRAQPPASETRAQLTRDGGGANISNINQAKLSELRISLPSFREQERIADELDALSTETQRLAGLYQRKLAALAALKKSLLHEAFSGEL